jgi:predicted RNase H-like HicB family nuclease
VIAMGKDTMNTVKFVCWQEDGGWIGYLQDYPDYWTQGDDIEDLKEHLRSLYEDVTSGTIPGIRKVEDLVIS